MGYTEIKTASGNAVTRITLNRPASYNAYTTTMCEELLDAINTYARDDSQRVLVITGDGRGFCSGGDLAGDFETKKAEKRQLGHAVVMREGMHPVSSALHHLDKPSIAMINGAAIAGGLTLALSCDIRIASDRAVIGDTSTVAGLLPDEGGAWLFPRAMGVDKALKMIYLSEKYDAHTAHDLGLVTEVVPHDELEWRVNALAADIAGRAPLSLRLAKWMVHRGLESSFDASLGDAQMAVMIANDSKDCEEGVAAFIEKRPPKFIGK